MIPTTAQTESIHALYCHLTKRDQRYTITSHFVWEAYLAHYTESDLRLVCGYIWKRIKAGKRTPEAFRLMNLVGSMSNFDDDLASARSDATIAQKEATRPKVSPAKANVLRATGRSETPSARDPVQAAAVVRGLVDKWAKELQ